MSSSAFRVQYYSERLAVYEQVALAQCSEAELLALAEEASSLRKFLTDIIEEGYIAVVQRLIDKIDAVNRLEAFLRAALDVLGPPSERERFYLMPEPVDLAALHTAVPEFGSRIELSTYLDVLEDRASGEPELARWFSDVCDMRRWQIKTQLIMTEMFGFLKWLCGRLIQRPPMVPVPLLRDTLLIHLGLTWLRREGLPLAMPVPIMMGRAFADTCGNGRRIHGDLSDVVHQVLLEYPGCDTETMRRQFARQVPQCPDIPDLFTEASRTYLNALALDGPPFLIESGVQGTFPLWLLTLTGNVGEMAFYTTLPWLLPTYRDIVFRPNYNYLREMETIVAHDYLFRFDAFHDGRVWIKESMHDMARDLALYEIHLFKTMVQQRKAEIIPA